MGVDPVIAIDLETTGLDPDGGRILEVAAVAVDRDMAETGVFQSLVGPANGESLEALLDSFDPDVLEMHHKSGLLSNLGKACSDQTWRESSKSALTLASVEERLTSFIGDQYNGKRPYLLGRNPSFDRGWLEHWMPAAAKALHYRSIDVTAFAWLEKYNSGLSTPKPQRTHRALDDARDAVAVAKWWTEAVQRTRAW